MRYLKKYKLSNVRSKRYLALATGVPTGAAVAVILVLMANQPTAVSLSASTGTPSSQPTGSTVTPSSQPTASTTTAPTTTAPTTTTMTPFVASALACTSSQLAIVNSPVILGRGMAQTTYSYPLKNISNSSCTVGGGMPTVLRLARASSTAALAANTSPVLAPYDVTSGLSASGAPNPFDLPENPITIAPGQFAGLWVVEGDIFPANVPFVQKSSPGYGAWLAQQNATPDSCEIVFSIPTPSGQAAVPLVYACKAVASPEQQKIDAMYPITPTTAWTSTMETALNAHYSP